MCRWYVWADLNSFDRHTWKGGDGINGHETKKYIGTLLHSLIDGLSDKTKTEEYRRFIKLNEHFQYSGNVMAKIKEHNPTYTKLTTSGIWDNVFGRTIKNNEKPLAIKTGNNTKRLLFDISQTAGKSPPTIYQNVSGKVKQYQPILDCLVKYSTQPVIFQEGASYYSGIGQDSFIENGNIVLRPALSEQQIIFALVREIVRHTQSFPIVVEAVGYIVCQHLEIDTSVFTLGCLLEILDYDESLQALKDTMLQDTIINEAEVFIGYLNAILPSQESESDSDIAVIDGISESTPKHEETETVTEKPRTKVERTETHNGIDFRFMKIIRDFMNTLPDKSIDMKTALAYGYHDTKMIPLRHNTATQLFSKGRTIYKLFTDNSEEQIEHLEEIAKHRGIFGIPQDDWTAMQAQILESGLSGEKVKIDRWSRIVAGEIKQERVKNTITENTNPNKANINGNSNTPNQADEPIFNADGSIVAVADDISHKEIENEVWLETALRLFFEQTGFLPISMPYFTNKEDFEITSEMKKINNLMVYYCAYNISTLINKNKSKSPDTGKIRYNVKKAVADICTIYSDRHITEALEKHWSDIKAQKAVIKAFDDCFEQLRKNRINKPRKPTPDENIRRVTAQSDATENTGAASQSPTNERNAEIFHIINTYNKHSTAKTKKSSAVKPILPPMPKQAR